MITAQGRRGLCAVADATNENSLDRQGNARHAGRTGMIAAKTQGAYLLLYLGLEPYDRCDQAGSCQVEDLSGACFSAGAS
jgi:hypothetical protein